MSMLNMQCERLRDRADELRMLASGMDAPYIVPETKKTMAYAMSSAASELNAAADTIDGLWESYGKVPEQGERENGGERESCSRWHELFGTPERAARTIVDSCNDDYVYGCGGCPVARMNCKCGDYDALLEWLRERVED